MGRRSRNSGRIVIKDTVLKSKAYRSLKNPTSFIVYADFLMKRQMVKVNQAKRQSAWLIANDGEIEYTYTEAEKKGISRQRFSKAIKELVEKGLIDISRHGGYFSGKKTLYSFSERWRKFGTAEFEEVKIVKDTRKGHGFAIYHAKRREKVENRKSDRA
jgi:hypothetical protein